MSPGKATLRFDAAEGTLKLRPAGVWTVRTLGRKGPSITRHAGHFNKAVIIGSEIVALDTVGALKLLNEATGNGVDAHKVEFSEGSAENRVIFDLVQNLYDEIQAPPASGKDRDILRSTGEKALNSLAALSSFLGFLGEFTVSLAQTIIHPGQFRLKEFIIQIERSGIRGIPIICMLTFLVGLVVAYVFVSQSAQYGASIFVVQAVGMGMTRELSPVITAILVAGRSGSAFTAQIGTMRLNDETDAMEMLTLSPIEVLVLPRVTALVVMLPFLVFLGDVSGILGGVVVAQTHLDIPPEMFFERLRSSLPPRFVYLGLLKAPVFGAVVGLIACHMGFNVEKNARSVGLKTTATVVQAIVAVIILNALFAVIFQELKL